MSIACCSIARAQKNSPAPPQPTTVSVEVSTPSLAPMPQTEATQSKGGVQISIDTDLFKTDVVPNPVKSPYEPGFKEMFHIPCTGQRNPNGGFNYYITNYEPLVVTKPDHLVMHLHITNNLPRVFRGAGALIQFTIGGKAIHVDPQGYGDFANAIIPPRSAQDIDIVGPAISDLPANATIGVFLYDVVTKMDDAGNIQEKQDFEWFYSWATQRQAKDATMPPAEKSCIRY